MDRLTQYTAKDVENDHVQGNRENELRDGVSNLRSKIELLIGILVCFALPFVVIGWTGFALMESTAKDQRAIARAMESNWRAAVNVAEQLKAERDAYKPAMRESFSAHDGVWRRTVDGPILGLFFRPLTDAEIKARALDEPEVKIPVARVQW